MSHLQSVPILKLYSERIAKTFGKKVGLALGRVLHRCESAEQEVEHLGHIVLAQRMMLKEVPVGCLTLSQLKKLTEKGVGG